MLRTNSRILAVDDDAQMLLLVRRTLEMEGYPVTTADSGESAITMFEKQQPSLVLLDIMMPGIDGYAVCQRIRHFSSVPIILLTGKDGDEEIVRGLDVGADDYVTKPFSVEVLVARVRAAFRRSQGSYPIPSCQTFDSAGLSMDFTRRWIAVDGKETRLTPKEFGLLEELVLNTGKVLTHSYLLNKVWGPDYRDERQYLHVFVRNLRAKLKLGQQGYGFIDSMAGVGYRFRA